MYEIKLSNFRIVPSLLEVIHVKLDIWGDEPRLNWGKICSYYQRTWKLVGELNCPYTCTSAYVEYGLRILDWGSIKRAAQAEAVDVMLEVETGLFNLVIWEVIFAFFICMISSTVFVEVVRDRGA